MPEPTDISDRLAAVFRRIHRERMSDVPILNPRLAVEATGTRSWNGHWLSALVTPWFINLMLLPGTEEIATSWRSLKLGLKTLHRFPAGRFEFIVGEEAELGRYQMCSLFSPVLEFESQEAARLAAEAALDALFDASLDPASAPVAENAADGRTAPGVDKSADGRDAPPAPPSRRGFLTGRLTPREGSA